MQFGCACRSSAAAKQSKRLVRSAHVLLQNVQDSADQDLPPPHGTYVSCCRLLFSSLVAMKYCSLLQSLSLELALHRQETKESDQTCSPWYKSGKPVLLHLIIQWFITWHAQWSCGKCTSLALLWSSSASVEMHCRVASNMTSHQSEFHGFCMILNMQAQKLTM